MITVDEVCTCMMWFAYSLFTLRKAHSSMESELFLERTDYTSLTRLVWQVVARYTLAMNGSFIVMLVVDLPEVDC